MTLMRARSGKSNYEQGPKRETKEGAIKRVFALRPGATNG